MYASMRFRARVTGSAGAVAGLFTFYDDNNEADIEILTRDPHTTYRFTNQPAVDKKGDDVPAASQAPTDLPSWQQWRTHRIDWVRGVVRWYVDDVLVARNSYSVPRRPSGIVLNLWGDGGEWGGEMAVGDQALMDVQWVEMVFNTSGRRDGPKKRKGSKKTKRGLHAVDDAPAHWFQKRKKRRNCMTVCAIDDVAQIGFPEVKFIASMASAGGAARAWLLVACLAIALDFIVGA
jgi:beta-glucanase (GH16 family)